MENIQTLSLQVKIIRQMQAQEGHAECYATNTAKNCSNLKCIWRADCFDDAPDDTDGDMAQTNSALNGHFKPESACIRKATS